MEDRIPEDDTGGMQGGTYIVSIDTKLLSKQVPSSSSTWSCITANRHLCSNGIAREPNADDCECHGEIVSNIPSVLLGIQHFIQIGNTIMTNELF